MKTIVLSIAFTVAASLCAPAVATDPKPEPKTSYTTDLSDIWWNPNESGWGVQFVHEANFIFATVFLYGANAQPTWITGQLSANGGLVFSGSSYVSTGPYYGSPQFNPAAVGTRLAGTMTFAPTSVSTGTFSYTVDGVAVNKAVQRLALVAENYNGSYLVSVNLSSTACFNPVGNGTLTGLMGINLAQTPTAMAMKWTFSDGSVCNYSGTYSQAGHLGTFNGTYLCSTGEVGTMQLFEMTNRVGMVSGRLQGKSTNAGCSYTGRFTGLDPNVP